MQECLPRPHRPRPPDRCAASRPQATATGDQAPLNAGHRAAAAAGLLAGRRAMLALLAATAAGCMPVDNQYVLMPVPGAPLTGSPMTVSVRGIVLPQALQRPDIIRTTDVPMSPEPVGIFWAEPLDLMIGRVLTQNLIQRLPGSYVFFDPRPPFTPADVWVELTLARFDTNRAGDVLVQASVGVIGLRFITRTAWKTVTPADGSTPALVTALSIALARFCDLIAALVVESHQQSFR